MSFTEITAFVGLAVQMGLLASGWLLVGMFVGLVVAVAVIALGWFLMRKREEKWLKFGKAEPWVRWGIMVVWIVSVPGITIGGGALVAVQYSVMSSLQKSDLIERACEHTLSYPVAYLWVEIEHGSADLSERELGALLEDYIDGRSKMVIADAGKKYATLSKSAFTNVLHSMVNQIKPTGEGPLMPFAKVLESKVKQWAAGQEFKTVELLISHISADLAKTDDGDGLASVSDFTSAVSRLYVEPLTYNELRHGIRMQWIMTVISTVFVFLGPLLVAQLVLVFLNRRNGGSNTGRGGMETGEDADPKQASTT